MKAGMCALMQMLAVHITRFSGPSTDRIKIKYCGLCESFSDRDTLTIRKDTSGRYVVLDIILQWMSPRVCFLHFLSLKSSPTCYRHQGLPRILLLSILIWHVFEQLSSFWIVCNFVGSILLTLEMTGCIIFCGFSINIQQRCLQALKPVNLKWSVSPS
jgi:hypothetical protein